MPDNRILVQAAREFGLETSSLSVIHHNDDDDDIGMLFLHFEKLTIVGMARNSCTHRVGTRITIGKSSNFSESMDWLR